MALIEVSQAPRKSGRILREEAAMRVEAARKLAERVGRAKAPQPLPMARPAQVSPAAPAAPVVESLSPPSAGRDWLLCVDGPIQLPIPAPWQMTVPKIAAMVTRRLGLDICDVRGKCRHYPVAWARQEVAYLSRILTRKSLPEIGRLLGGYDHTTMRYGVLAHAKRHGLPNPAGVNVDAAMRMLFEGPSAYGAPVQK